VQSLLHTAPHVTTIFEADFGAILAHRARYRSEFAAQGAAPTLTTYIMAACVDAIRAVPEVNARWHEDSLEIFDSIDIGVGTAVEGKGLIVPVIRAVQSLNLKDIASELGRLVDAAREDRLTPADVRGGTFTISNHGVSGSLVAAPIVINQPQVAILGVGKLEKRVAVLEQAGEDKITVRPRCYLSLTIDHRALDGDRANRFLQVLVERLEEWPQHT
jgi:2-oxoglutarate dehydrogenase E2 component (dihydrolipoamide succinyltransferase)